MWTWRCVVLGSTPSALGGGVAPYSCSCCILHGSLYFCLILTNNLRHIQTSFEVGDGLKFASGLTAPLPPTFLLLPYSPTPSPLSPLSPPLPPPFALSPPFPPLCNTLRPSSCALEMKTMESISAWQGIPLFPCAVTPGTGGLRTPGTDRGPSGSPCSPQPHTAPASHQGLPANSLPKLLK